MSRPTTQKSTFLDDRQHLEREPAPLDLTPLLQRVIRTCLAKDPDHRFQNALDLKRDLTWAIEPPIAATTNRRAWIAAAAAMLMRDADSGCDERAAQFDEDCEA